MVRLGAGLCILSIGQRKFLRWSLPILALFLILGASVVRTHGAMTTTRNDRSFAGRVTIWKYAIRNISRHPLFGGGYESSRLHISHSSGSKQHGVSEPKNLLLDIAVDTGVAGLTFFLLFLSSSWITAQKLSFGSSSRYQTIGFTYMAIVTSILVSGLIDTPIIGEPERLPLV